MVYTRVPQVKNGGHFEKNRSKNRLISATVRLTGDCHLARWRKLTLLTLSDVKISIFLKSKMADGRNYENRKIRHYMALCQGPASERGKDPNVSERQDR